MDGFLERYVPNRQDLKQSNCRMSTNNERWNKMAGGRKVQDPNIAE
jgi:hypothetical protein